MFVVKLEFVRMGTQTHGIHFIVPLVLDPSADDILGEDTALCEEVVIRLESIERLFERTGRLGYLGRFFRRKVVDVLVERLTRIDLVLNAVECRHHDGREGKVRIAGRVGTTELNPLGLRRLRIHRNAAAGRTVALRVGQIDRCFKARHETLVAVRRRVGESVESLGVLQDSTDGIERILGKTGVFVPGEKRLATLPDGKVRVHAGAVVVEERLGHEGGPSSRGGKPHS